MSNDATRLRAAADELGDARGELDVDGLDVDAPDEAPSPGAIVGKIDDQLGELQVALQELAANVDVMEDLDDG